MRLHALSYSTLKPPPLAPDDPHAIVLPGGSGKLPVIAKRVGEWCWLKVEGLATFRFAADSPDRSVSAVAHPEHQTDERYVLDAYYRMVVPLALQSYGLESLHGAAVETEAGALALCGPSHAGKTTLTYALSARGHRVLADDGLVVEIPQAVGPQAPPVLHPIPFSLLLREPAAAYFGSAAGLADGTAEAREASGSPVPLAAVVLLERRPGTEPLPTAVTRLEPREAFTTLMSHGYRSSFDIKDRNARTVAAFIRFAEATPVYRLTYTSGLEHLAATAEVVERHVTVVGQRR